MNTLHSRAAKIALVALLCVLPAAGSAQHGPSSAATGATPHAADANVIYGMYSGLALLMDVYRPARPNGLGVVFIAGSGWSASPLMGARPMKDNPEQLKLFVARLVEAGYTVFALNHRATPRFQYPTQVEDVSRAVRFVRHHANSYGIDAQRIGAAGYSSGANLAIMLGVTTGEGNPADLDAINRESARVQCVVAAAAPADLTHPTLPQGFEMLTAYVGMPVSAETSKDSRAYELLVKASPLSYVTADDAPSLFFNGTHDKLVPTTNVRRIVDALQKASVPARLIEIEGAAHWPLDVPGAPDFTSEMVRWFDRYLRGVHSN